MPPERQILARLPGQERVGRLKFDGYSMKGFVTGFVLGFTLSAGGAAAEDVHDARTLFRERAWAVDLIHDSRDGTLWCSAETENRAGQTLSLAAYETGALALFVFDPGWSIARRPMEVLLDLDRSWWTMEGTGEGGAVSIGLDAPERTVAFLVEMQEADAVSMATAGGGRRATFLLGGSGAGIAALMACWNAILSPVDPSDPFVPGREYLG